VEGHDKKKSSVSRLTCAPTFKFVLAPLPAYSLENRAPGIPAIQARKSGQIGLMNLVLSCIDVSELKVPTFWRQVGDLNAMIWSYQFSLPYMQSGRRSQPNNSNKREATGMLVCLIRNNHNNNSFTIIKRFGSVWWYCSAICGSLMLCAMFSAFRNNKMDCQFCMLCLRFWNSSLDFVAVVVKCGNFTKCPLQPLDLKLSSVVISAVAIAYMLLLCRQLVSYFKFTWIAHNK